MNILRVVVENPDELLNSSAFNSGALVRVEYSSDGSSYSELSTSALVAGTTIYTFYHSAGTTSTYYRSRYSNSGGSTFSDYSVAWQVTSPPIEYTTLSLVKLRLNIGASDTTDNTLIEQAAAEANSFVEGRIGFPVGPTASEERLFDGSQVRWRDGVPYLSCYPFGVRTVSAVRTAASTGASYTTQTASDVVARPHSYERQPGWPAFELWIKDTASWTWTSFGYDVNGVTATWGWDSVPADLQGIATRLAVAIFRRRGYGSGAQYGVGEDVTALVAAEELSSADWNTIRKYAALRGFNG